MPYEREENQSGRACFGPFQLVCLREGPFCLITFAAPTIGMQEEVRHLSSGLAQACVI